MRERREQHRNMKNKYLTRCLCITLLSTMVLSSPASIFAAAEDTFMSDGLFDDQPDFSGEPAEPTGTPDITPTPGGEDPQITPTPSVDPTPTPGVEPTPTPGVDPTPTPGVSPTPTPTPPITAPATPQEIVDRLNELSAELLLTGITLEYEDEIIEIRSAYEILTEEEKAQVTNYQILLDFEAALEELKKQQITPTPSVTPSPTPTPSVSDGDNGFSDGQNSNVTNVLTGTPVYYTNMVSNLHAGKEFYLDSLQEIYQLSFSEDFASVMEEIENEYKQKNKLSDASDLRADGLTTSADTLLVRNWQDIIAIYIYEQYQNGATSYTLDASCKDRLAEIFAEMNPVVRDKSDITRVTYGNRYINYYIKKNKIPKKDRKILQKYMETDCKLLCAVVTASKGFVRQSVGEEVSEERVNVIAEAYSLVGEVGYFWGGKSTVLGKDSRWGTAATVSASGSNSTGTLRAYGLDCSGFVTWAVINGYQNQGMQSAVGDGTSDQWNKANIVSEEDAQPGDLVFQRGPEAGSDNHVGIICGQTDSGDWIVVHCSSSQNGVTVGEAYSAGFRYIRQPSFYPTDEEVAAMESQGAATSNSSFTSDDVTVSNTLQDVISENTFVSQGSSLLTDAPLVDDNDIEVFVAPSE